VPWFQILVMLLILVVLFGRGRMGDVMGDFRKGVKSFRHALSEDDDRGPRPDAVPAAEPQPSSDATGK
jgi:sec-independent protein translocase protein TatA